MQSDLTDSNHCIEQDNSVEQSFMKKNTQKNLLKKSLLLETNN